MLTTITTPGSNSCRVFYYQEMYYEEDRTGTGLMVFLLRRCSNFGLRPGRKYSVKKHAYSIGNNKNNACIFKMRQPRAGGPVKRRNTEIEIKYAENCVTGKKGYCMAFGAVKHK